MDNLLATTPPGELDELLSGDPATAFAGGHPHLPLLRQHRGVLLCNPGSVGMPIREFAGGGPPTILARGEYATAEAVEGQPVVGLRRVAVDQAAVARAWAGSDNPLRSAIRSARG